jgi:hypothetical protein
MAASVSTGKDLKVLPFRETSRAVPFSRKARARNPSSFGSKIQSG